MWWIGIVVIAWFHQLFHFFLLQKVKVRLSRNIQSYFSIKNEHMNNESFQFGIFFSDVLCLSEKLWIHLVRSIRSLVPYGHWFVPLNLILLYITYFFTENTNLLRLNHANLQHLTKRTLPVWIFRTVTRSILIIMVMLVKLHIYYAQIDINLNFYFALFASRNVDRLVLLGFAVSSRRYRLNQIFWQFYSFLHIS